jgi:signal transduction histidine kinase
MSDSAKVTMRQHPARAMYHKIEDALTSITMQLRSAIYADVNTPSRVNGKVNGASGPLRRASGWARQVATELGSVLLDTLGLAATIDWHLHQVQKCTGILYELAVNNAAGFDLPEEHTATIFDVYSEALSNVARHAGASRVAIALTITPHEVTLVVRDNGIGLGEEASRSSRGGIAGMRARAQSHKGLCEFAGARNAGTTVTVSLPIARAS